MRIEIMPTLEELAHIGPVDHDRRRLNIAPDLLR